MELCLLKDNSSTRADRQHASDVRTVRLGLQILSVYKITFNRIRLALPWSRQRSHVVTEKLPSFSWLAIMPKSCRGFGRRFPAVLVPFRCRFFSEERWWKNKCLLGAISNSREFKFGRFLEAAGCRLFSIMSQ